jgi:hypothetical protein
MVFPVTIINSHTKYKSKQTGLDADKKERKQRGRFEQDLLLPMWPVACTKPKSCATKALTSPIIAADIVYGMLVVMKLILIDCRPFKYVLRFTFHILRARRSRDNYYCTMSLLSLLSVSEPEQNASQVSFHIYG